MHLLDPHFLTFMVLTLTFGMYVHGSSYGSTPLTTTAGQSKFHIKDSEVKADVVYQGLNFPTSMAFLRPNDILVLEKNTGTVQRIINGTILPQPLLRVNVSTEAERGMLGIDVSKDKSNNATYVFLYYTESNQNKEGNLNPLGNRLYRYELVNDKLVKPRLLVDMPYSPGPTHNGGKVVIGPDNNVYFTVGDINSVHTGKNITQTQNVRTALPPDGRGGILRITQDGKAVLNENSLGEKAPLNLYYAYGIRNSFGIAFDPLTEKLWDTENGPGFGDEINLVEPGFNSGWSQIQGIWKPNHDSEGNIMMTPGDLVDFGGKRKYGEPKFIWNRTVGPTAMVFLNSDKLGEKYKNDLFVGDFNQGRIFYFRLDKARSNLVLEKPLEDKIADATRELQDIIFGQGFGGITDLKVGPDGYLYVLSLYPSDEGNWHSADCDRKK